MGKICGFILGILLLVSCSGKDWQPKYHEFSNDWERENLFGEVREIELYKANVIDHRSNFIGEPMISHRYVFTRFGRLENKELFDNTGQVRQSHKNLFDKNQKIVETTSKNFPLQSFSREIFEFDEAGNVITQTAIVNDTINMARKFSYDNRGNLVMRKNIEANDTTVVRILYEHDEKGKLLLKRQQTLVGKDIKEQTGEYQYDQKGNLIKSINRSEIFDHQTTFIYSANNILRKIEYQDKGHMNREVYFDKHYNPVLVKYYHENELVNEMKYKYRFDKKGNWTWRKLYLREMVEKKRKFQAVIIETREIGYFE